MPQFRKFLLLNQMAGPLFRELAEDLAEAMPEGCVLITGHPDTIRLGSASDKLRICRAPRYIRRSNWSRIFSWVRFTIFAFSRMMWASQNTVFLVVSNPPLLGPVACLVRYLRSIPYIVLVYDLHPDTLIRFGVLREKSLVARIWRALNRMVWNRSLAVYTIGPVMAERLALNFEPGKTRLGRVGIIPPWADTERIIPIEKSENPLAAELGQQDCVTVLYSGNLGISHDIEGMLEAARILDSRKDIRFLFVGEGAKWLQVVNYIDRHHLDNVQVLPFQPEEKLPLIMALGEICLVSLDKGAEGLMLPSKTFYYMSAGAAVIGICQGRNDLREAVKASQCGLLVEPGQPEKLAKTIVSLVDDKSRLELFRSNARKASVRYYSRDACMRNMLDSLKSIGLLE